MKINFVILSVSVLVWLLLLGDTHHLVIVEHCPAFNAGPSAASIQWLLRMNPISTQLTSWGLMVAAMMLPKLIIPLQYINTRSLKRNRLHLSLLFILGYMAIWMAAGVFMTMVILLLHLYFPGSWWPAIGFGVIAIIWQCSPVKQRCLNKGHDHWTLAAFGWPASRDALKFGLMHGVWCVGSGWAIMLLPMLLPNGHNVAMLMVAFIMFSEHVEHPQIPRWRIDFRTRLYRILVAQTQIKWKQLRASN